MFETEITVNRFLLGYAAGLMEGIPDERLAEIPAPGVNSPAWNIGHLAFTGDAAVALLGGERTLPAGWGEQFGPNSTPTATRSDYPGKQELLDLLQSRFAEAHELAQTALPEAMQAANPRPHLRDRLPTVGDLVAFLLTGHFGIHCGQLSVWRRLIGIGRLF